MSAFLDFEAFDLDFVDFLVFFGFVLVSDMTLWSSKLSKSSVGASEAVDWVDRREEALDDLGFFDREDLAFLLGCCANTKKEQSEERR